MIAFIVLIAVCLGLSLRYNFLYLIIPAIAFLVFVFIRFKKWSFILCTSLMLISVGVSYIHLEFTQETYQGMIIESKDNYFIFSSKTERLYVSNYNNTYEAGDILKIKGTKSDLNFTHLESEFDFESYLNKKGVTKQLKVNNIEVVFSTPLKINSFRKSFLSHFDEDAQNLIGAILFSRYDSSNSVLTNASSLHLMRLTSASGIYIYLFLRVINYLLSLKLKEKHADIISLGILSPYLIFTFPKFSVIRIAVVRLFRWLNKYIFKHKLDYLTLLSLIALGFLIIDYHLVYQDSFILGFSIPFLVYFLNPLFQKKKKWQKSLYTTLAITIFFIPFSLSYYSEIAILSPIYQILLTPLFTLLALIGLICFIGIPIYSVGNFITNIIGSILGILVKANPTIYAPAMNGFLIIIFEFIYISFLYYHSIHFKPIEKSILVVACLLGTLYFVPVNNYITEQVSFINVGQGDACLVRKGNTAVLIDTGGNVYKDIATEVLIPYFKKERIYDIDLVITTHDDYDHSGALSSLQEHFTVKEYVSDPYAFPLTVGGIEFTNYNYTTDSSDENDNSLVISFSLANKDFVITGDAPIEVEEEIMANYSSIPCDILKVGHHGSNTSTCDEWVKFLDPDEAVISCGLNNSYGHPHASVIKILEANGVTIKRTDLMGTITYENYIFT